MSTIESTIESYRAGEPDPSINWIHKSMESMGYVDSAPLQALNLSLLAIAEHKTGKSEEAQKSLSEANSLIDAQLLKLASGENAGWHDWLIAEIIRREAEAFIGKDGAKTPRPEISAE